jgi:iron complex outermembrane recepter protein
MKTRLLIISLFVSSLSFADDIKQLAPTVVTATRVETNSFDLPVSIDVVEKEKIQDANFGMSLSESLIRVPGVTAQSRTSYAQDPQISTRGFGSRSAFGVRGVRVLVDGITLSMPDGIAQPGNIDLETAKSIEVMRGPFSALYGSSSGGVINIRTQDAPLNTDFGASVIYGSYGTSKESVRLTGTQNSVGYLIDTSHFESDGYRNQSASWKDQVTAKLKFDISSDTKATVLLDWFDSKAQDPLALARSNGYDQKKDTSKTAPVACNSTTPCYTDSTNAYYSAFTNPKAVPDVALSDNTRVERSNTQIGLNLEHKFNSNNFLNLKGSFGHRDNIQYLALPVISTTSLSFPTAFDLVRGRKSIIARDFFNTELSWTNNGSFFSKNYSFTTGVAYGYMNDARQDINARNGEALDSSVVANNNRNENDIAYNLDQFFQAKIEAFNNVDFHAGLRHSLVNERFSNHPALTAATINGVLNFEKTTPVTGVIWKVNPSVNLYANYGEGFETPTLIETAFSSASSATGPNLNLKASTSENYELGLKAFILKETQLGVAYYKVKTENEIVIEQNSTYTKYQNSPKTGREGIEFSMDSKLPSNFNFYTSYTYLDAKFNSQYTSGVGATAGATGIVNKGNIIPGTYKQQLYAELAWKYPAYNFKTALETRVNSKTYINDINSDAAPGYGIVNLRAGLDQYLGNWKVTEFLKAENIFDKNYIGSVRVNDANNRNFEAAPARNYLVGVSASYQFK